MRAGAPSLVAALRAGTDVAVIAEVKRRSPSKGVLNSGLGAAGAGKQARLRAEQHRQTEPQDGDRHQDLEQREASLHGDARSP